MNSRNDNVETKYVNIPPEDTSFTQSPPSCTKYIDQISMQLLLNKTGYQKYLSKTDPQKHQEYQEYLDNCSRLRRPIIDITSRLLDGDKDKYTQEINNAFKEYSQVLIRYLELKEKNDILEGSSEFCDEDMMFPPSMDEDDYEQPLTHREVNAFFHVPSNSRRNR